MEVASCSEHPQVTADDMWAHTKLKLESWQWTMVDPESGTQPLSYICDSLPKLAITIILAIQSHTTVGQKYHAGEQDQCIHQAVFLEAGSWDNNMGQSESITEHLKTSYQVHTWSRHLENSPKGKPGTVSLEILSWSSAHIVIPVPTGFKSSGAIFLATKHSRPVALCLGSTTGSGYCPPWRETEKLRKALQSRKDPEVAAWGEPCCPGLGVVLRCPSWITDPNNQDQILRQTYSSKINKANIQITNKNDCLYWPKLSHTPVLV